MAYCSFKTLMGLAFIAVVILVRTKTPTSVRRRDAPPHTIWVLICPDTGGYSYNSQQCCHTFVNWYSKASFA
jgi:hypothetical protein